jgi:hypothetical protein
LPCARELAVRHGVARIDQIGDDLLELPDVGFHLPKIAAKFYVEHNPLAQQPLGLFRVGERLAKIDDLRPQRRRRSASRCRTRPPPGWRSVIC